MALNPERLVELSTQLSHEGEREQARKELAGFLAGIVPFYEWIFSDKIEKALAHVPKEHRQAFALELASIAEEVGWKEAHKVLSGELKLDREIERAVGSRPDVKFYRHTVQRPEDIQHFKDFFKPEGGPTHYWIPRKFDIRRYVRIAQLAHERSGRTGPIRVLDVGGGSGFLGKLIADEARAQGLDVEVTVIDPDETIVAEAQSTFTDTENLKFDVGTAVDAVTKYGPELPGVKKVRFEELERQRIELITSGRQELAVINATLTAFEGIETPSDILKGPYQDTAKRVLREAGIDVSRGESAEHIRDAVADYYKIRQQTLQETIQRIRDEQEDLYGEVGCQKAKVDVVLNSWMPLGLDFTRELRWVNAPAIIYARERGGATGVDYVGDSSDDLGKEHSYELGRFYHREDDLWWEGISSSSVASFARDEDFVRRSDYYGGGANASDVVLRKGINIHEADLGEPPSDEEKYPWERSLEDLIGRKRVDNLEFY